MVSRKDFIGGAPRSPRRAAKASPVPQAPAEPDKRLVMLLTGAEAHHAELLKLSRVAKVVLGSTELTDRLHSEVLRAYRVAKLAKDLADLA